MELQGFAPQHLYSQLEYAGPQGLVIDMRGTIATAMAELVGTDNVMLHPTAAEVQSADGRNQYRTGVAQIYSSLMAFDDFDAAREQTREFLVLAIDAADDPEIAAINLKTYDIAPVDSFERLRDRLGSRLASGLSDLDAGMPVSDIGWVIEFKEVETTATVHFGAMESEQLKGLLRDEEGTEYPPSTLFLDVDLKMRPKTATKRDPLEWWTDALGEQRKMTRHIGDWLKEVVA